MAQLSEYKRYNTWKSNWKDQSEIDPLEYINFNIHPEDVLILGHLLFPNFIEFEGYVFFEDRFSQEAFNQWKGQLGDDRVAIEKMINHIHVYDIFDQCQEDVEDGVFEGIAKMLKRSWEGLLLKQFPNRKLVVNFEHSDSG